MNERTKTIAFCLFHGAVILGGLSWVVARANQIEIAKHPPLPEPRQVPVHVGPLRDDPNVISDERLARALAKLQPRLRGPRPKINHVDHALRCWGVEAMFADPESLSGLEMRDLLVDYRSFRAAWGEQTRPLLVLDEAGVRVRVQEGPETSSHVDHTLATLGEIGTPIDAPVLLDGGEATVRDLFEYARRSFSLNQKEYEWTTLALALYAPTREAWLTTEGQRIDFGTLVRRIVRQEPTFGVCYGHHRLHTLVMLLRIDDEVDLLDDETRAFVVEYLQGITATLVETQAEEGFWDGDWDGSERLEGGSSWTPIQRRVLATGHALEWWALAPDAVQPPREVVVAAAEWMADRIDEFTPSEVRAHYTFLTHAGRALALWRGRFPHEVAIPAPK